MLISYPRFQAYIFIIRLRLFASPSSNFLYQSKMTSFSRLRPLLLVAVSVFIGTGQMARTKESLHDPPPIWTTSADCLINNTATIPDHSSHTLPSGRDYSPPTVALHEAPTHCPNLSSLHLRDTSYWPYRWHLPLALAGNQTWEVPYTIDLQDYNFDHSQWKDAAPPDSWIDIGAWSMWVRSGRAARWWEYRKLPTEQRSKTSLDLWLDAMESGESWSISLRVRWAMSESLMEKATPRLGSLRDLTLNDAPNCGQSLAWIARLEPLTFLTWFDGFEPTGDALTVLLDCHVRLWRRCS
ncbi:hypothetical protein BU16DRAFT_338442 [Lophium mytilinum]|uniref:Uncharacterized protein n=1 Tax=Lophium mytilinum TaxID=390894 RepID=A0A6A6QX34_9PEZI|nr:hypothetical protein BU16DRAFT_338442 [Lophium mytilinum]